MRQSRLGGLLIISFIFASGLLSGCQTIHYLGQAIDGQMDLLSRRQPVAELIADPQTPPDLKSRLHLATELLEFAEAELYLPAADQYRTYVSLDRPYVVWNVFAAPEFSLQPRTWCYPVAGCTAYRGYFSEENARRDAQRLIDSGYDVMVGGVAAYSTLGWFNDPLLSTFINASEPQMAALIFHELAHQLLYVRGDSVFNESFATAVAHEGMRRWYASRGKPDQYHHYMRFYHQKLEMVALISEFRQKLTNLYQNDMPPVAKRRQKIGLFRQLRQEFDSRRSERKRLAAFAHWFDSSMNNAKLVSIATYNDYVPAFNHMLKDHQHDLEQFYQQCRSLSAFEPGKRHSALQQMLP